MLDTLSVKIDGKEFIGTPITVIPNGFMVSWRYSPSQVSQQGFEMRIGSFNFGLGTDSFVGNAFEYNSENQGRQSYGFYPSTSIPRSREIYGQIRIKDQFGVLSFWKTFTTYVNDLPHIISAKTNDDYSINNGISLIVKKPNDVMIKVRWYQNGKLQTYLDDSMSVPSRNIEYGDSWLAQVIPHDELENGFSVDVGPVVIPIPVISGTGIEIIPSIPNPDDILEIKYRLTKNGMSENFGDESVVRWYVNGVEVIGSSGSKFARLNIRPGDIVYARIDTNWSGFSGSTLVSPSIVVGAYNLQLRHLTINGTNESGSISYDSVNAFWAIPDSIRSIVEKFSIKVGHADGGSSVYSTSVDGSTYSIFIPPSVLKKGMDYYLSVAPINTMGNIGIYETVYFKTFGNIWKDNVSATTGYTILLNLKCVPENSTATPVDVLSLNVSDGSRAYVIDFYTNFVRINVDSQIKVKSGVDNTKFRNYIISVFNKNIFIYVDGQFVCNYTDLNQLSNDRSLTLIPRGNEGDLKSTVSSIRISTTGAYHMNSSEITGLTSFSEVIDLPNAIVNDVENTPNGILVSVKDTSSIYSKIYNYNPAKASYKFGVESISSSSFYVNDVSSSPGSSAFCLSTSRGSTVFVGDPILEWDASVEFRSISDLYINGWTGFSSSDEGISVSSSGLILSSDFKTIGVASKLRRSNALEFPSLSIQLIFDNDYYIVVENGYIYFKSSEDPDLITYSIDLSNYTISSLVTYVRDLPATSSGTLYIRDYMRIEILNDSGSLSASELVSFNGSGINSLDSIIYINNPAESVDPYTDAFQTSFAGGKSYIAHDSPGNPWYDRASSDIGYSIELDIKVSALEDSLRPIDTKSPDLFGVYINDGNYDQEIQLYSSGISISRLGYRLGVDLSEFTKLRFNGSNGQMQIWKKSIGERDYSLLGKLSLNEIKEVSRHAKKHVVTYSNGVHYFLWIEEDGDFDVVKYSISKDNSIWSSVKSVPILNTSIKSIDIAVDSSDVIYIVYESFAFDHSDIYIISKNDYGWSSQFNVTNDRGASSQPKLFIDSEDNVHVIWADSRSGIQEIMHAYLDGNSRSWIGAGASAIRVSSSNYGAHSPAISGRLGQIFATWTESGTNGGSQIRLSKYDLVSKTWYGQNGLAIDVIVSDVTRSRADYSDVIVDKDGNVHIVYHDIINDHYKIMHRQCSPSLSFYGTPISVVDAEENTDSIRPSISLVDSSGDIILTWRKVNKYTSHITNIDIPEYDIQDPYNQNIVLTDPNVSTAEDSIYFARWARTYRSWLSSGNRISTEGGTIGGFDIKLTVGIIAIDSYAVMPKLLSSSALISLLISDQSFGGINRIYSYELDTQLSSAELTHDEEDPYSYSLTAVSDMGMKKSLLIGDSSSHISGSMTIKSINYSVTGKKNPFMFRKIGYLTHLISSDPIIKTFVSDNGDAWIVNKSGFYYYDFSIDQVTNSWDSSLWDNNHLDYLLPYPDGGSPGYSIKDAFIDEFGNLFAAVEHLETLNVFVSADHTRWFKIAVIGPGEGSVNFEFDVTKNIKISFNNNGNMVISQVGQTCLIKNYIKTFRDEILTSSVDIITTGEDEDDDKRKKALTVNLTYASRVKSPLLSGISNINDLSIDDDNNIFISTNLGLFFGSINSIVLLTRQDGMPGDIIRAVYPITANSRLCTYENAVASMNGSVFEEIPLTSSYPISSADGIIRNDRTIRSFNTGRLIRSISYGNYILVCGKNGLVIRFDGDPILGRRLPNSVFFGPELLDLVSADEARNIGSREMKFNIPEDLKIDPDISSYLVEVILNGNRITRGYEFSAKEQVLYFLTSLLQNDVVTFNLRGDFKIDNDFSQNGAEKAAFGIESRDAKMVSFNSEQSYVIVTGSSDYIAVKNSEIDLPYDEVILDRVPPQAKVRFVSQTGPDSIVISIDQIVTADGGSTPYDSVSGISTMIVSNYDNFTLDGSNSISPSLFRPVVGHDLISALSNNAIIQETDVEYYEKLFRFTIPGSVEKLYVITSSPIRIYERSTSGEMSNIPLSTMEDSSTDFSVGFVQKFGNSIIIGTRSIGGLSSGKLFKSNNLQEFELISTLPGSGATCGFISSFDQSLYIGTDGFSISDPSGTIIRYDGTSATTYKTRLDKAVMSITGLERFLFAGTSDSGYIYRIDIASGVVEIIHSDPSGSVLSLSTLGTAIFAGVSDTGIIIRAKNNDAGFIQSFRTAPTDIQVMKTLKLSDASNVLFAAAGKQIYSFRNTWTLEGFSSLDITDFEIDENETIIFCSSKQIKSIQAGAGTSRKVFVKLIDNAGNETDIRSAPDDDEPVDGYNDNLTLTLTSEELSSTYLQSKLLEVNSDGIIEYSINGDAPFYSGERIVKETGVYYTDIFNGTTGHVSWGKVSWQGSALVGTSIRMYVRVSETKADLTTAAFQLEIDELENNVDISFLSGQYLQIKVVLSSTVDISPYVSQIVVTNNAGSASHFFTNTFPLPASIKRGIITLDKDVPIGSDIIIGVSGTDATDFSQYQIIPENRIFSLDSSYQGDKLRVGFRFITPQSVSTTQSGEDIGSIEGLGSILSNSVAFEFENNTGTIRLVDFKIEIFEDANLIIRKTEFDSLSSPQLFRINGNPFPSGGGVSVLSGFEYKIHFIPFGAELSCDVTYYVRVSVIEGGTTSTYGSTIPLQRLCGVNFINDIVFTYINSQPSVQNLHFEIAFYEDEIRSSLFRSYSSQYASFIYTYLADFFAYPQSGLILEPNQSSVLSFGLDAFELSKFTQSKNYYVTISYFDLNQPALSRSVESMNFTFRVSMIDDTISCGSISGVPVLKGFAFMFELEDGRLIKFNYLS